MGPYRNKKKTRIISIAIAIIFIAMVVAGAWYWKQSKDGVSGNQNSVKVVIKEVGRHVLLPTDETPALATVVNSSKLKFNKFLSQAKNGDKILIYAKWGQAVLYRPSIDRVVDISPVDVALTGNNSGYVPLK